MKGLVYKVSSPSNKIYYGYTSASLETRKFYHYRQLRQGKNTRFLAALKKYDDLMLWEIVEEIEAPSKEILHKILTEKERFWITKEKTFLKEFGYNMTKGGDGRIGSTHSEKTRKVLSKKLMGRTTERRGVSFKEEMIEKYGEKEGLKRHENWIQKMRESHCKSILQFDENNNLIKEWSSMKEANDAGFIGTNINACIKGRRKTASGFKWRYKL